MATKIRLEHITKIYGRDPRGQALELLHAGKGKDEIFAKTRHVVGVNNVSFDVEEGEIFVVMGLSGSGKSTLIRCVNRLIEPTDGAIYVDDTDITKLDKPQLREMRRTKMAMVFQHFALFPHKSVIYNVGYGLNVRGVREEEWRERSLKALEMVGLRMWAEHYPHNLSGGMQQRVGLARALATDADILLMDEAFSALDPLIRREMQNELLTLQEDLQKTILFITHDLGEALRVGGRVAVMRGGAVVQIGTPQEIITEPADDYVAEFMADVDTGRVLTAEFIMSPATTVSLRRNTVQDALRRMDFEGINEIYVLDDTARVDGILRRPNLEALNDRGERDFSSAIRGDFPRVPRFARLYELYDLSARGEPIAVIGDRGKLEGVVYPLYIFEALARDNGNGHSNDSSDSQHGHSNGRSNGHTDAQTVSDSTAMPEPVAADADNN
ncbi:MAG: glycine betaine/L-proline ABC transporter ATP-binding protein [Chloroflexi bacterium]|nr:glycine betaine/L-proline ABC transporter ATP-binding protein [Chloroflexota bacterium]